MGADQYSPRRSRAFYYLNKDFHDAESLYEYIKYGLYMRNCLEIIGPYQVNINHEKHFHQYLSPEDKYNPNLTLEKFQSKESFSKHRSRIDNFAKAQLLSTFFVIFEYFINNLYDDLNSIINTPNGLLASDLHLIISDFNRKSLKELPSLVNYSNDKTNWKQKTHHWDTLKNEF
jgi:hypothetical protein